ncbi:MAG TPA: hypothetical protein VFV17_01565 [Usitatibacteraceae bacterium]|nr:hypothetical protein [Usitatibacteraceae bacterium]
MKQIRWFVPCLLASSLLAVCNADTALAQDKVAGPKVEAPKKGEPTRTPLIDNESVSVIEVKFLPGDVSSSRQRPGRVIHYITGGQFLLTYPDGKTEVRKFKAGETIWRAAETTEVKNNGKSTVRLVQVVAKSK